MVGGEEVGPVGGGGFGGGVGSGEVELDAPAVAGCVEVRGGFTVVGLGGWRRGVGRLEEFAGLRPCAVSDHLLSVERREPGAQAFVQSVSHP